MQERVAAHYRMREEWNDPWSVSLMLRYQQTALIRHISIWEQRER